jgi:hypothetical protein
MYQSGALYHHSQDAVTKEEVDLGNSGSHGNTSVHVSYIQPNHYAPASHEHLLNSLQTQLLILAE